MARLKKSARLLLFCFLMNAMGTVFAEENAALDGSTFAVINGEQISTISFISALNSGMRKRFYHGNIPAERMAAFKEELAQKLIDDMLLLQEARRQKLEPDNKSVQQELDRYERRYGESENWQSRRESLLTQLRTELENKSLIKRMTEKMKELAPPSGSRVRRFYEENPEIFTTPQKRKVSLILLGVAPSSTVSVWENTHGEAEKLLQRIKAGESFAELAKIHSADTQSAGAGGDMGYLHQGMLAEEAEQVLAKLKLGELSEPINTLHGVVILRLEDIAPARLNAFEAVRERATGLLKREMSEQNFQSSLQALRSQASIQVNRALIER